jgi:hypothetical protein
MNEFFTLFTCSVSSTANIKNENCKGVSYIFLRAGLVLGEPRKPSKEKERTTGNLVYNILRQMTSEHVPTIMYLEQVKLCYSPCYLAVLSNNNFEFMGMYT